MMETEKNSTHAPIHKTELFEVINEYQAQEDRLTKLNELGISLWDSDLIEYGNSMFLKLLKATFTDEGIDWILWWLCEKPSLGDGTQAYDENGNPIPTETLEDLWNIVEPYRRI